MSSLHQAYPDLSGIYTIGQTVMGRNLTVMKIGTNVNDQERPILRPMAKLVANMHGNEVTGRELMLDLMKNLLRQGCSIHFVCSRAGLGNLKLFAGRIPPLSDHLGQPTHHRQ